ncbi:MAG: hypothetical protein WAT71_05805 [Ignavibacteria bacterium]
MKVLLDENLDPRLKDRLTSDKFSFEIFSVRDMNWLGLKNGELLKKAILGNFDIFVSADQQLKYQQNLPALKINIVILKLVKNNFSNQILKLAELALISERIFSDKTKIGYFEI